MNHLDRVKRLYETHPSHFEDRVDGLCTMPWLQAKEDNTQEWKNAIILAAEPGSHYDFLDRNFDTVLTHTGKADRIKYRGNFSASGDKYYTYRERWEEAGIPFFHGAVMYHLIELEFYKEVRDTPNGWVHPWQWVIDNYKSGHNLSQYMEGLS